MSRPYLVAALLVEQPTWGGSYIADFKGVQDPAVKNTKIGQAFELASDSLLVTSDATAAYGVGIATDLAHATWNTPADQLMPIQQLIDTDPAGVLGTKSLSKYGPVMKILIKFTQAKNNSYQVHVKPGQEFGTWQAKPESWYYLERGLATLGLAPDCDVAAYQQRCQEIEAEAIKISEQVMANTLTVEAGRQQLADFINQDHPRRFVNTVSIEPNQIIDLSGGGLHHSWEVSPDVPEGNRLYEVQVDVRDEFCTLRSFDQGNIKDDGKVRPITVNDYFKALDATPAYNEAKQYFRSPATETGERGEQITHLFSNQYYESLKVTFNGDYQSHLTQPDQTFHHLFVEQGQLALTCGETKLNVGQGWSVFIPANCPPYQLSSPDSCTIIMTRVS